MAAYVSGVDKGTGCTSFTISSPADISKLPTTVSAGTDELKYVNPIPGGDALCISTSEIYVLDAEDDTWKVI